MTTKIHPFAVRLWGSHPDNDNDDLWTLFEFDTREEAEQYFRVGIEDETHESTEYFELVAGCDDDGIGGTRLDIRANPTHKRDADDDSEWRSEIQMQHAMEFGVQGWNDFEGM